MKAIQTVLTALLASLLSLSVHAATITTYASQAAYQAGTGANTALSFTDNLEYWGGVYKGSSFTQDGVTFSDTSARLFVLQAGYYYDTLPGKYLNNNNGGDTVTIDFAAPINAFAMHFGTIHNWGYADSLTEKFAFAGSETSFLLPGEMAYRGTGMSFVGYSSDTAFSSVRITDLTHGLAILDLMFTTFPTHGDAVGQVPEPGSLALLGLGLLGLGAARRTKRQAKS